MREVYTIFDQSWVANVRTHTGSEPGSSFVTSQKELPGNNSAQGNKTHCKIDRESTPPDDRHGKKNKKNPTLPSLEETRLWACPFHKFDQSKYSCYTMTGSRYRACVGPGFATILDTYTIPSTGRTSGTRSKTAQLRGNVKTSRTFRVVRNKRGLLRTRSL